MSRRGVAGYMTLAAAAVSTTIVVAARATTSKSATPAPMKSSREAAADPIVGLGRYLVISHACGGCHGGSDDDPSSKGWLAGEQSPLQTFLIGPCAITPGAQPCFHTHPRNLTPDNETGLGRFTERQIFNALRFGLRPEGTPDVTITSTTPGKGNYPLHPHMLAPPMPWPSWRHMPDNELKAIAAYLKRGLKPVSNKVPESEGPPDFWVSAYAQMPELHVGTYPAAAFPSVNEVGSPVKAAATPPD